jgi:hypothetical protein
MLLVKGTEPSWRLLSVVANLGSVECSRGSSAIARANADGIEQQATCAAITLKQHLHSSNDQYSISHAGQRAHRYGLHISNTYIIKTNKTA